MKRDIPNSTKRFTRILSPSRTGGGKVVGILCLLLSFLLFSCSKDDDEPQPVEYAKTVFIYMPWTGSETSSLGSLLSFFNRNLNDIQSVIKTTGDDNVKTIVFLASNANNAELFEIKSDGTRQAIKDYTTGAMTTTSTLESLLSDVYHYAPSQAYSMVIGSHADGWLPAGSQPAQSRSFGGQTATLQVDITTLASAITSSPIRKMQFICFDDCYMANVETAYALRQATDWFIASTSEIMEDGLPYRTIWQFMSSVNPDYSKIIDGFGSFYSSFSYPYGSLSAIDCTKMDKVADLMKNFNNKYDSISNTQKDEIQALDGYNQHVFYDMKDYLRIACDNDTVSNSELFKTIEEAVPYKFCTPELYTVYQFSGTFTVNHFSGITISDPSTNIAAVNSKKETEWWKATH